MAKRKRKTSRRGRGGRDLELLVERVERILQGSSATIVRNDRIPDMDTGEEREIDLSVRFPAGDVPVLLIFECRDRSRVQDVRWIEELSAKARSVGAARAIAVSSSGFSQSAILKARACNIDLRSADRVSVDDFKKRTPLRLQFERTVLRIVRSFIRVDSSGGPLGNLSIGFEERVFCVNRTGSDSHRRHSIEELLQELHPFLKPLESSDQQNLLELVVGGGLVLHYDRRTWSVLELRLVVAIEEQSVSNLPIKSATGYGPVAGTANAVVASLDVREAAKDLSGAHLVVADDGRFELVAEYGGQQQNLMKGRLAVTP
jgi:hypothetical protein